MEHLTGNAASETRRPPRGEDLADAQLKASIERGANTVQGVGTESPAYNRGFRDGLIASDSRVKALDIVDHVFTYHPPNSDQIKQFQSIRDTAKFLARTIIANTPHCPDQREALNMLADAVMKANRSIACDGIGF